MQKPVPPSYSEGKCHFFNLTFLFLFIYFETGFLCSFGACPGTGSFFFLINFIELYIFSLLPSLPLPFPSTLSHGPHAPNLLRGSCLFYFPCRLNPCMSLLGSLKLSRFSEIVNCRLVFFALCLKAIYE